MGKRSRSDRKKARERAASGDWPAVRALCERNPASGAKVLVAWLQDPTHGEPDSEVLEVAAGTSARLRADIKFDQAYALCSAAGGRTVDLRMEEAAAAFACGDDDRVRKLASLDSAVARMVEPWLAAIAGKRVPSALCGSPAPWRTILAVSRVVSALVQGRTGRTRELLAPIRQPERSRFFVADLMHASSLLAARNDDQMQVAVPLSRSSVVRASPQARGALAMTVAKHAPQLFLDQLSHDMDLGEEATRDAAIHALCAVSGVDGPQASVSLMIARMGADAFAADERANALLQEGFAFSHAEPKRAREAIDRAVSLGADLLEALRGRFLVERAQMHALCEESGPAMQEAVRALASNANSLATHLLRDPDGAPFAAVALLEAAQALIWLRDNDKALDLVAKCRQLADQGGFLSEPLDLRLTLHEAEARSRKQPERALQLVDQVLGRDPKHQGAWEVKIALVGHRNPDAADDLILRASELKVSPHWCQEARQIRKERGTSVAMVPGQATAGELASEMLARFSNGRKASTTGPRLDDDLEACRAALDSDRRTAFDVASIAILAAHQESGRALQRVVDLLADQNLPAEQQRRLIAITLGTFDSTSLGLLVHRIAQAGKTHLAVDALRMLVRDDGAEIAQKLLPKLAPMLARSELCGLQHLVNDAVQGHIPPDLPDPRKIVSAVDSLLAPDASVMELLASDDFVVDSDSEMMTQVQELLLLLRNHPRGVPGALDQFFDAFGIPRTKLRGMSPQKRRRVEDLFRSMLKAPGPLLLIESFAEMCKEIGFAPSAGLDEPLPF